MKPPEPPHEIVGTKAIARELNTSPRTVLRLVADGSLPVFRLRGATSPLRITADDLGEFRRALQAAVKEREDRT